MRHTPSIILEAAGSFSVCTLPDNRIRITLGEVSGLPEAGTDTLYDKKGVADRLMVTTRSIDNFMRQKNALPYSTSAGHPRFRESDVVRWLDLGLSPAARRARAKVM